MLSYCSGLSKLKCQRLILHIMSFEHAQIFIETLQEKEYENGTIYFFFYVDSIVVLHGGKAILVKVVKVR